MTSQHADPDGTTIAPPLTAAKAPEPADAQGPAPSLEEALAALAGEAPDA